MNANTSAEHPDLEYEYTEDQLTEKPGTEPIIEKELEAPKAKSRFSRKKIITVVVVCAMVGAIFQFLNNRDKAAENGSQPEIEQTAKVVKKAKPVAEKPIARQNIAEVVQSKPAIKPQLTVTKVAEPEITKQEPTAIEQLEKLPAPATSVATTQYQPEIKELQTGLNTVNQSVSGLQQTLLTLTNSVQALSNQVAQLSKEQKAKSVAMAQAKPEVKVQYYLKAIITGRAWIESETGDLTTVKVGDELPSYGTITAIDPENATVTTSAGGTIKHAPNDS
ncbi:MAG TPA: hypothetical protein VHE99_09840 [Gammaproteobacteria bacterium]|nr:hypothetical protein [Gammaproteobacteria bacterium]